MKEADVTKLLWTEKGSEACGSSCHRLIKQKGLKDQDIFLAHSLFEIIFFKKRSPKFTRTIIHSANFIRTK